MSAAQATGSTYFNPPAPCGAGHQAAYETAMETDFNPPAPCGAGLEPRYRVPYIQPISIHPPLAGRDNVNNRLFRFHSISIHPPLAGRDLLRRCARLSALHFNPPAPCGAGPIARGVCDCFGVFQSTRPLRGGTRPRGCLKRVPTISIHPPLAGRDYLIAPRAINTIISIHPPLAGRDELCGSWLWITGISIHPPLAGRDLHALPFARAHTI